jgi:hypothetical protein
VRIVVSASLNIISAHVNLPSPRTNTNPPVLIGSVSNQGKNHPTQSFGVLRRIGIKFAANGSLRDVMEGRTQLPSIKDMSDKRQKLAISRGPPA